MGQLPKFNGDILDIGNEYYLIKKNVLHVYLERMQVLEQEIAKINEKRPPSNRTVIGSDVGRKKSLEPQDEITAWELRQKGYSLREIGEVMKVSHETVRQAVKAVQEINDKAKHEERALKGSQGFLNEIEVAKPSNVFGTAEKGVKSKISENPLERD